MSEHHRTAAWAKTTATARPRIQSTLPAPCIDCGKPIYPDQRWQVGHVVSVAQGKAQGWTTAQINAASNLGPSHTKGPNQRACNQIAGGRLGAAVSNVKRASDRRLLPW